MKKISDSFPTKFPAEWYQIGDENHFWFEWRFMVFYRLLQQLNILNNNYKVLDIGCGHGVLRRQLEKVTNWHIDGTDLNEGILPKNKMCRGETYLYNINEMKPQFKEKYDGIILFDILEHIEKPEQFIKSVLFHLKHEGWIFINVPALNFLYSKYDVITGHFKRYNKKNILAEFLNENIEFKMMNYWGISMIPILLLRKFILFFKKYDPSIIKIGLQPPSEFINVLFKKLMYIETKLVNKPYWGTSLLVIATKQ